MDNPPGAAQKVCYNCKIRKRKCSKDLPSCQLCTKLLMECRYDYETIATRPILKFHDQNHGEDASSAGDYPAFDSSSPSSSTSTSRSISLTNPSALDVCSQVLDFLLGLGESVPSVVATYFRTIDLWLPVISQETVQRSFQDIRTNPSVELGVLLLCMHVITRMPGDDGSDTMNSSAYLQAKSLYSYQSSLGKGKIEIVQAGLLLALYEQGHGLLDAAQMSMTTASRMGTKMVTASQRAGRDIFESDLGNLWWGIVILDRFMNLGIDPGEIYLSTGFTKDGILDIDLPCDLEAVALERTAESNFTPSGVSTSTPTTRLGPFCRTAEASHLLGQVLELVANPSPDQSSREDKESKFLDGELQKLAMSLLQQATNGWEECCAAIGICFSALLMLHTKGFEFTCSTAENTLATTSAINIVIDIARRFHMDRAYIDLPGLPLPSTFCVYQAALLHIHMSRDEFMSQQWQDDMTNLKNTLEQFTRRWDIGRTYLKHIDEEMETMLIKRSSMEY